MAQRKIVYSCPAYDVYESPMHWRYNDLLHLKHGMPLACKDFREQYKCFSAGSMMGYCRDDLAPGENMQDHINESLARGPEHKEHWINANAVCITDHKQARVHYFEVKIGQKVLFEGKVYEIVKESNDNLGLKPVEYNA